MSKRYLKNEKGVVRAVTTDNLQLEKPLLNENYDIEVHNRNMEKIDTAIQGLKSSVSSNASNISQRPKNSTLDYSHNNPCIIHRNTPRFLRHNRVDFSIHRTTIPTHRTTRQRSRSLFLIAILTPICPYRNHRHSTTHTARNHNPRTHVPHHSQFAD